LNDTDETRTQCAALTIAFGNRGQRAGHLETS
jgi:hypothetical protein